MTAQEIITTTNLNGSAQVIPGVWISTMAEMLESQSEWDEGDEMKNFVFDTCPYWITTDDGVEPIGISDVADLERFIATMED
jgi:ABC-type proline/glycine betaine transport system substrate-binding protein